MWKYWLLLTDLGEAEIEAERRRVAAGAKHPMEVKKELAATIVTEFHSAEAAAEARDEFERVFSGGHLPQDIPEIELGGESPTLPLIRVVVEAGMAASNSEARRLVQQGGVKVQGEQVKDIKAEIDTTSSEPLLLQVGKRKHARIRFVRS
jgi:tyrosyl-tRNA synthetase